MAKASLRLRLLVAVLGPLLVLGAVELCLRIVGYSYDPYAELTGGRAHDELAEAQLYVSDPDLIWTLKPSTVLYDPPLGFRGAHTNSLGLRGAELLDAGAGLKVLCLGDSITFGLGLPDEETFPAQLAAEFQAAGLEVEVAVVNGGVPGWSSVQGGRLLERLRQWEPDVVVFWFGVNDSKVARGLPDARQVAGAGALGSITRALRTLRLFQLMQRLLAPRFDPEARRVSVAEFAAIVEEIREEWGDRAVFVRTPGRFDVTISELEAIIADAERLEMSVVVGPNALLIPWTPAAEGTNFTGQVMQTGGELALVYESRHADKRVTLEKLKSDLELLVRLERELDARRDTLPENSLGYPELFGDELPMRIFSDNCHLKSFGAKLAAQSLAYEIVRRLD